MRRLGMSVYPNHKKINEIVDYILLYTPNKENLYRCHNFYPHIYTGLDCNHFIKCSEQFK